MEDFNAHQARELAKNKRLVDLEDILLKIKKEAEEGNEFLYFYDNICNEVEQILIDKGFTVSLRDDWRDGSFYVIKW